MSEQCPETATATLLLVDDEENMLNSLRRVLRNEPYTLLMATSGEKALGLMEEKDVDLVISDARMPGMDGATLLANIQQKWPNCLRILLTGYADISTTVRAINEGHIYRYISKPWDDDELRLIIRQALAYQFTERERQRLEQLTLSQNRQLQELNADLENRVKARTAEIQQVADMLDLAYAELKHSYVTATEVFSSLLNLRLPRDRQTNSRVVELVKAYAQHYQLDEALGRNLSMAAALYNLGKLTWEDSLFNKPSDLLYKNELEQYRRYPELGEGLLMTLEPLRDAAKLIRHHQERWNGSGFPDHLKENQIPLGARLLRLAVDFVELQQGMVLERKLERDEALSLLQKYSGRLYDPQLCERFVSLCQELDLDTVMTDDTILKLDTRRLEPGMILVRDLYAENGTLLLNEGKELDDWLILRLIKFEDSEDASYTLYVRKSQEKTIQ
ncbi:two-component system response regulator [Litchfieldella qijiaojingensis]|uniref:Two-component system response regulator n=1 Tax=Litchfieldella qijiaojingensis TaxID=980347 RepID=A0ABQ2YHJ7_9GAMM|nr:HD domain-containing phosphohydrolase [Halomonas qijiaojingensis]GGX82296.1 two-component system response regulator [Halomonas qijiaojingensis]